jgi:pSer/pThr/pTyr-binding forkhead associated (FHA) protein
MPSVRVLFGDEEMMKVNLVKDMYVIGRQEGCEIHIDNLGISRTHARLMRDGDGYRVEDLGSSNGTFVNGEQVQRQPLGDGDVLTLGKFEVVYQAASLDGAPTPPATEPANRGDTAIGNPDGALNTMAMDGDAIRKRMQELRSRDTAAVEPPHAEEAAAPVHHATPTASTAAANAGQAEIRAREAEIEILKRDLGRMRILTMLLALVSIGAVVAAVLLAKG